MSDVQTPSTSTTADAFDPIQPIKGPAEGVAVSTPASHRFQRRIALAVVVVPFVGTLAAIALAARYGVSNTSLVLFAVMYFLSMTGISVGYHRHFAHRAFRTSPGMQIALGILGSMAAQGPVLFWVSTHRRHHAYSDQEGDPHSPNLHGQGPFGYIKGLWHAHVGWMLSEQITSWAHYARDLMRERRIFWLNQTYPIWTIAGLVAPAVINGLVDGSWLGALNGFLWGGMVRMFAMNQASWCVGSLCHLYGSRPFRTHDNSANNWPVALFTFGEGLQNNHHAFPSSAHHAVKWYEPDVSAWTIRALQKTGLIWNVLLPSPAVIEGARRTTTAPSNNN